jgi:hypothetical protein
MPVLGMGALECLLSPWLDFSTSSEIIAEEGSHCPVTDFYA